MFITAVPSKNLFHAGFKVEGFNKCILGGGGLLLATLREAEVVLSQRHLHPRSVAGAPQHQLVLVVEVESQQLVAGELGFTVGTLSVVEPPVFNFNVAAQVVLAQALLRAEVTVVDRINLEKEDQTQDQGKGSWVSLYSNRKRNQRHLERVVGRKVKLETMVVLQFRDCSGASGQRAVVEGGGHHVLVVEVPQPQGLLAVQKHPEKRTGDAEREYVLCPIMISPTDRTNLLSWFRAWQTNASMCFLLVLPQLGDDNNLYRMV